MSSPTSSDLGVPGIARCGGCAHKIEPGWAFCPACGADNRAPERRFATAAHVHDLKYGTHCILCGHLPDAGAASGRPITNGYSFVRDWSFRLTGLGICASGVWVCFDRSLGRDGLIAGGLAVLAGLVFMLVTSRTTIDVDRGEVEWCKGIRPFVVRHKSPLSEFSGIHLAVRSRGRGGWNYVLFLQHMSGREVLVDDSRPFQTMDATGRSLAAAFGLPYTADSPTLFGGVL